MTYFKREDRLPTTFKFYNDEYGLAEVEICLDTKVVKVSIPRLGTKFERRMQSPSCSYNAALHYIAIAIEHWRFGDPTTD